jgi:hypothetical protein
VPIGIFRSDDGSISIDYNQSIFEVKADIVRFIHQRGSNFEYDYVSHVCLLLDKSFFNY